MLLLPYSYIRVYTESHCSLWWNGMKICFHWEIGLTWCASKLKLKTVCLCAPILHMRMKSLCESGFGTEKKSHYEIESRFFGNNFQNYDHGLWLIIAFHIVVLSILHYTYRFCLFFFTSTENCVFGVLVLVLLRLDLSNARFMYRTHTRHGGASAYSSMIQYLCL